MCNALKTPGCETARRLAAAEAENERLRNVLREIACFGDYSAEMKLSRTGSYGGFDEPGSVQIARAALQEAPRDGR